MNIQQQQALIRLSHIKGMGNQRLRQLIHYFHDPCEALHADNAAWHLAKMPSQVIEFRHRTSQANIALDFLFLEKPQCTLLTWWDQDYPALLAQTSDAPALLYLCGERSILSAPQIAVVGTRHPTEQGIRNAQRFSTALANSGMVITSGLALGIDAIAHLSCVNQQLPTIAVLGTGLNEIYPQVHKSLAKDIIGTGGLLVSEFYCATPPLGRNFPKRNRIIAGLSLGTLVVEATTRSGSLITARISTEENREVFAIPSHIDNTQAKGCHYLIQQGAKLTQSVSDILEEYQQWITAPSLEIADSLHKLNPQTNLQKTNIEVHKSKKYQQLSHDLQRSTETASMPTRDGLAILLNSVNPEFLPVLKCLSALPLNIDQLVARTGLESSVVSHILLMLELEELIGVKPGGYVINNI